MKKIVALIFTISLSALVFFNTCKTGKYNEEIATIDSLMTVLNNSEKLLNKIDTNEISLHFDIYIQNLSKIRESFSDRDDEEAWQVYTRYGLIRKYLRDYKKNHDEFVKEIAVAKNQLDALKQNIKKNTFEEELIEQYIHEEAAFVTYISISVEHLVEHTTTYNEMFKELNPKVEKLIEK